MQKLYNFSPGSWPGDHEVIHHRRYSCPVHSARQRGSVVIGLNHKPVRLYKRMRNQQKCMIVL